MLGASARVFAVLGDPVSHSLSPRMHNAAFRAMGLDAVYVALRVDRALLIDAMRLLAAAGGGGNVTIPHKGIAAECPGLREPEVERLGVANTFVADGAAVRLANTDVAGVLEGLKQLDAPATVWCVIGTGGSARAVAGAARVVGARVAVKSRNAARAAAFGEWLQAIGVGLAVEEECEVAINTTPLGRDDRDPLPVSPGELPNARAALDLTYRTDCATPWVQACAAAGLAAADGREVLLSQGAAAWRLWLPGLTPPREVMRAALRGRLV
jgi:shikimate dehydrogenase